ncbi:MAG: hypothetical protein H3Z53_09965 [archaeon]|nr:hypothetical protein [archaeon]MCP8314676.1 hypothetical protein [archaeon]
MNEINYRIKYRKGDFEVEVQGDKEWVEKKFKELAEGKVVAPEAPTPEVKVLPTSLVEFIKAKGNPSEHTDIAILFSYWLHKKEKMGSYNKDDIEKCYTEARITKPMNITDVMNRLQGKGYLMPAPEKKDNKKAWVITRSGEEYVEQMKS